jgi:hypothetical protein
MRASFLGRPSAPHDRVTTSPHQTTTASKHKYISKYMHGWMNASTYQLINGPHHQNGSATKHERTPNMLHSFLDVFQRDSKCSGSPAIKSYPFAFPEMVSHRKGTSDFHDDSGLIRHCHQTFLDESQCNDSVLWLIDIFMA